MVNNIHKIRTNYTDFTYIIKVSNSSESNSLLCISKNEVNEKKEGVTSLHLQEELRYDQSHSMST